MKLIMHLLDLGLLTALLASMFAAFLAAWKVRRLKSQFVAERQADVQQVLAEIGELHSVVEAQRRATAIAQIMERLQVAAAFLPLTSGGRVGLLLGPEGL